MDKPNRNLLENSQDSAVMNESISISFDTCLDRLIPDSEKPSKDSFSEDVEKALSYGLLTQASGMGQITNCFNDAVYAAVLIDENENRSVQFCQRYADGNFSALFTIGQETLLTIAMGKQNPDMEKEVKRCVKKVINEYFRKTTGKDMLPIQEVLEVLLQQLPNLPEIRSNCSMTPAQLYNDVMDILKKTPTGPLSNPCQVKEGFIALGPCDIDYIATELDMSTQKLLKLLRSNRLLHLTESCDGYQAKIAKGRDKNGKTIYQWAYCLYDMEYATKKLNQKGGKG